MQVALLRDFGESLNSFYLPCRKMGRPRYHINRKDWLDCLDWLDYQCARSDWYTTVNHPAQIFGISKLKRSVRDWRAVTRPSDEDLATVQEILICVLTAEDWSRLRKALSARKRRRREAIQDAKPINITLTPTAHQLLVEYRDLTDSGTLSDAIELGLQSAMLDARRFKEKNLETTIREWLESQPPKAIIKSSERYLTITNKRKTLANSCRFAQQVFNRRRNTDNFKLLRERFIEDLIWNELHLKVGFQQLPIWDEVD